MSGAKGLVERHWTCFHCDETFTDERCARLHFGDDEEGKAACQIKAGAEGSILRALRDAERETRRAWGIVHSEIGDVHKAYYAAQCRHTQALQAAEELGYERGLADGRSEAATLIERQEQAAGKLVEALEPYLAGMDEEQWCQRLMHGQCSSRKCNVDGGWSVGNPADYSKATCARYRLEAALREYQEAHNGN